MQVFSTLGPSTTSNCAQRELVPHRLHRGTATASHLPYVFNLRYIHAEIHDKLSARSHLLRHGPYPMAQHH